MNNMESGEGVARVLGRLSHVIDSVAEAWVMRSYQVDKRTDEELSSQKKQQISEGRKFGKFKIIEMKSVEYSD